MRNVGVVIYSYGMESCLVIMMNLISKEFRVSGLYVGLEMIIVSVIFVVVYCKNLLFLWFYLSLLMRILVIKVYLVFYWFIFVV